MEQLCSALKMEPDVIVDVGFSDTVLKITENLSFLELTRLVTPPWQFQKTISANRACSWSQGVSLVAVLLSGPMTRILLTSLLFLQLQLILDNRLGEMVWSLGLDKPLPFYSPVENSLHWFLLSSLHCFYSPQFGSY